MRETIDTNTPLDGELSVIGEESSTQDEKKQIGRVTNKYIFNRKGQKLATFSEIKKITLENGKSHRARVYLGDDGSYEVVGVLVYRNGILIGRIKFFQKISNLIISLVLLLLFFLAITGLIIQFIPGPTPPVETYLDGQDKNGPWSDQKTIAVFDSQIQPGSSGEYEFSIVNKGNVDLLYSFTISEIFELQNVTNFPMQYRLEHNDEYLCDWSKASEVEVSDYTLVTGQKHDFTLEWRWLFEGENDEIDTFYGQIGGEYFIVLNIEVEHKTED